MIVKHTQGPFYKTGRGLRLRIREVATDNVIATMEDGGHIDEDVQLIDDETIEANADLFAASPDLARELKGALGELAGYASVDIHNPPSWFTTVHDTKYDALAKAQGKS